MSITLQREASAAQSTQAAEAVNMPGESEKVGNVI